MQNIQGSQLSKLLIYTKIARLDLLKLCIFNNGKLFFPNKACSESGKIRGRKNGSMYDLTV